MCASARVIKHSRFKAKKRAWKDSRVVLFWRRRNFFFLSLDCSLTKQRQDLPFFLDKKSLTNITTNNKGVFFFSSSLKRAVRLR